MRVIQYEDGKFYELTDCWDWNDYGQSWQKLRKDEIKINNIDLEPFIELNRNEKTILKELKLNYSIECIQEYSFDLGLIHAPEPIARYYRLTDTARETVIYFDILTKGRKRLYHVEFGPFRLDPYNFRDNKMEVLDIVLFTKRIKEKIEFNKDLRKRLK